MSYLREIRLSEVPLITSAMRRACRNVAQLITAFRDEDQVIISMPYQPNDDFRVSPVSLDDQPARFHVETTPILA